jgi:hypothetical protein
VFALSEAIDTVVSNGTVLSNVTLLLLVVAVTVVPALPARSVKDILKDTFPDASLLTIV